MERRAFMKKALLLAGAAAVVRYTLVSGAGEALGEKNFSGSDPKAESSYELPSGAKGTFYATSFCNLHDFWLTEFTV